MKVAILPWGNVIEDYLDGIGATVRTFATGMEGGWLFGYADALVAAGAEACIVVVSRDARVPEIIVNPRSGIQTIVLPGPGTYRWLRRVTLGAPLAGLAAISPRVLAKALKARGCTHLVVQEYADPRFDRLAVPLRDAGLRVFASFQGGQDEPRTAFGRALRRTALKAAEGLIIAASGEAERVRGLYGELPVARIFNPVDPGTWYAEDRTACRRALGLPETARIAICHCRIDMRRKGLDILIAAWREVVARHPERDLRLHLVGDGPDRKELHALLAADPVPGLRWLDRFTQDRAEMRRELSAADLHVQASRHEGFAVAPMEAMACGLPTVLSRAPGAADLLEGGEASGGMLVPVGDAVALADALSALLGDDARRAGLAAAAAAHVLSVGATAAVGRQLVDFLSGPAG